MCGVDEKQCGFGLTPPYMLPKFGQWLSNFPLLVELSLELHALMFCRICSEAHNKNELHS